MKWRHICATYHVDPWSIGLGLPEVEAFCVIDSVRNEMEREEAERANKR